MKSLTFVALLGFTHVHGWGLKCDYSADVLFVQDLQASMSRALREAEDDAEDIIEELEDVFRRPRAGIITFREVQQLGCVDIPVPLSRNDDLIEDVYERLRVGQASTIKDKGSALSALSGALSWPEVGWQSANRIVVLFTNNEPLPANSTVPASAENFRGCRRLVASPSAEEVISKLKATRTTVLFVIPRASAQVNRYWTNFNSMLGQPSHMITTRTHDLDDWVESKKTFFRKLQADNCASHRLTAGDSADA